MATSSEHTEWTDERVELGVATLLRIGVYIAAVITALGGIVYLATQGSVPVDYSTFRGTSAELHSIRGIISGVLALHSQALIQLGLLLLIATPIARVALSLHGFFKQHDRTYMVVTTIVLAVLLFSLSGKQ
jgi:uncharacterized membrane protein